MAIEKSLVGSSAYEIFKRPVGAIARMMWFQRGLAESRRLKVVPGDSPVRNPNDLERYFDSVKSGHGIWKWRHYFDIYHRHFEKFRNKPVNVLEIGIYSGGSLKMWKEYFGPGCHVYGVDIAESCKVYEGDGVEVFIGDQADRGFWKQFKEKVRDIDIIVDDGGHEPNQQLATLEELLPHLNPGGVYLCEDIHGTFNKFAFYINGLSCELNATSMQFNPDDKERFLASEASPFQTAVHSVHLYPFVVVIERNSAGVTEFVSPKHGTQWQPYTSVSTILGEMSEP